MQLALTRGVHLRRRPAISERSERRVPWWLWPLYAVWIVYANRIGSEEGFVFGGGSAVFAPDGTEVAVADPLEPEELTAVLDPGAQRRARIANPAHGIERHELLIDALSRAAAPQAMGTVEPGRRAEARP